MTDIKDNKTMQKSNTPYTLSERTSPAVSDSRDPYSGEYDDQNQEENLLNNDNNVNEVAPASKVSLLWSTSNLMNQLFVFILGRTSLTRVSLILSLRLGDPVLGQWHTHLPVHFLREWPLFWLHADRDWRVHLCLHRLAGGQMCGVL